MPSRYIENDRTAEILWQRYQDRTSAVTGDRLGDPANERREWNLFKDWLYDHGYPPVRLVMFRRIAKLSPTTEK